MSPSAHADPGSGWALHSPCVMRLARIAMLMALVQGCGNGSPGEEAGVGGGGSGVGPAGAVTTGTVTGFGSLVVDGVRWDDSTALTRIEYDPTVPPIAVTTQLGHRVRVEAEVLGTADAVSIEPELVAPITSIDAACRCEFTAAGQTVLINVAPDRGPVTVFDGFGTADQLLPGDVVEVHGAQRFEGRNGVVAIAASRVQRLAALPAGHVRMSGITVQVNNTNRTFRLGGLTVDTSAAAIQSGGRALADGQTVTVWSRSLPSARDRTSLRASVVRVADAADSAPTETSLSGYVTGFANAARTFRIGGRSINASNAAVSPAGAHLVNDAYVRVTGRQQVDGSVAATAIEVRSATPRGLYVDLSGTVSGYQGLDNFLLRGVRVDADDVAVLTNCPNNRIGNGSFVNVVGTIKGSKVEAVQLQCANSSAGLVVDVSGLASQVSIANKSFRLTPAGLPAREVLWGPLTLFDRVSPATLDDEEVEVIGLNDQASGKLLAVYVRRQ